MAALTTRDATLPVSYSEGLEALALGPLWTALQQLLPGERAIRAVPHACESRIAGRSLAWERGDTLVAPPWHWVEHENLTDTAACVFQVNDEPALRALGLFHEETERRP